MVERVRALEAAHNGLVEVAKIDARWMRCAAREECEVKEKGAMISDGMQPAAVTNPMSEATTSSGSGTGLRTERVTLELTHCSRYPASEWAWEPALHIGEPDAPTRSVRVVPTPGVRLTEEEIAVCVGLRDYCRGTWITWGCKDTLWLNRAKTLGALLARDAASRESGSSGPELGSESGSEIARLTAERDAALARAADAERAYESEATARAQAVAELEAARAAPTPEDASELERVLRMLPDAVASMNHGDPVEGPQVNAADCVRWAIAEIDRLRAAPPTPRVVRLPRWCASGVGAAVIKARLMDAGVGWEVEE